MFRIRFMAAILFVLYLAAPALAQDSERRLYRIPEDAAQGNSANQEVPAEKRQWVIVEVPRFDIHGHAVEVLACKAFIQAEYPSVPASAPEWCDDPDNDPMYDDPACEPPFSGRSPTVIEERIAEPTQLIQILLHGLGGNVDVDVSCESPGGVGPPKTLDLELGGAGPPADPVVTACSHAVMHAGQTVCQPQE